MISRFAYEPDNIYVHKVTLISIFLVIKLPISNTDLFQDFFAQLLFIIVWTMNSIYKIRCLSWHEGCIIRYYILYIYEPQKMLK